MKVSKWMILFFLSFLACGKKDDIIDFDTVSIRITNQSSVEFLQVEVKSGSGENTYTGIQPGKSSGYKPFEEAYRYGYIRAKTAIGEFTIQPFDYVGEQTLVPGKYSYMLNITDNRLTLTFTED